MMLGNKIFSLRNVQLRRSKIKFLPPACDHKRRASLRAMGRWCLPKAQSRAEPLDDHQGLVTWWLVFA